MAGIEMRASRVGVAEDSCQKPDRQGGLARRRLPLLTRGLLTPQITLDWRSRNILLCCAQTIAAGRAADSP